MKEEAINLKKLTSKLPRHSAKIIAEQCNTTVPKVRAVLYGFNKPHDGIIEAAIKIVEQENEKIRMFNERINQL